MNGQHEVLCPWAEVDPIPLKGLSPRVENLEGKKIGLFALTYKPAAKPMLTVVEKRFKEKFSGVEFSYFERNTGADLDITTSDEYQMRSRRPDDFEEVLAKFEEWVKGVDAVVGAVGS